MKIKYYVEGTDGKVLVRTSANEYKYALVYKNNIIRGCSIKKEILEDKIKYCTKGYGHNFNEKINGKYLYSSQFDNPNDYKIVELVKEVK